MDATTMSVRGMATVLRMFAAIVEGEAEYFMDNGEVDMTLLAEYAASEGWERWTHEDLDEETNELWDAAFHVAQTVEAVKEVCCG